MAGFKNPSVENKLIIPKSCGVFFENILRYDVNKKIKRSRALNTNMPLLDFYPTLKMQA